MRNAYHIRSLKPLELIDIRDNARPLYMVFVSAPEKEGWVHHNTLFSGAETLIKYLKSHCKLQRIDGSFQIDLVEKWLSKNHPDTNAEYDDIWVQFIDKSWVTITWNPNIQIAYKKIAKRKKNRDKRIVKDGVPVGVRCYDLWERSKVRVSTKVRWVACFGSPRITMHKKEVKFMKLEISPDVKHFTVTATHNPWDKRAYGFPRYGEVTTKHGKRIRWEDLPAKVKVFILREYLKFWEYKDPNTDNENVRIYAKRFEDPDRPVLKGELPR